MKEKLIIGSWSGVPEYNLLQKNDDAFLEAQLKNLVDSGIDLAPVPICPGSEEYRLKMLEFAQKYGVKQLVEDPEMSMFLKTLKGRPSVKESEAVGLIRKYSEKYLRYDSFAGYFITDEPSAAEAENLVFASKIFKKALPDKLFYFNLFPRYALPSCLKTDSYDEYIEAFGAADTDYFSYDFYALLKENGKNYVRDGFWENLVKAKELCDVLGKKLWTFCCSSTHFGGEVRGAESYAEAAFQAFVNYTLGASGIFWFCFYAPDVDDSYLDAMVDRTGKIDVAFENVKRVNKELKAMDEYLSDYECCLRGAIRNGKTETFGGKPLYEKDSLIRDMTSDLDVVFALYKGKSGKGILITNFDEPTSSRENTVKIIVKSEEAAVFCGGSESRIKCPNGIFEYTLKNGGAIFVAPLGR